MPVKQRNTNQNKISLDSNRYKIISMGITFLDIVGPLPLTENTMKYIPTFQDNVKKYFYRNTFTKSNR
jgi:hypothetical protein